MRREILWVVALGTSDDKQPHAESAEFRGGRGKSLVQPLLVFRSGRDFKYPGPSDDKQPHAEGAEFRGGRGKSIVQPLLFSDSCRGIRLF